MLLSCRNSSNTAQNILRTGKCAINFVDDKPATFKECVKLSWPGDKPEDKMPRCNFRLEQSQIQEETGEQRPMVLSDAIQVIECTWVSTLDNAQDDKPGCLEGYEQPYHDFNGITSKFGAHFILKIDRILMKKQYSDAIIRGVKSADFPPLPVDYGYRDSKNFWFHRKRRMRAELLPMRKQTLESVRYAADRVDDKVKFTDDALETISARKKRTRSNLFFHKGERLWYFPCIFGCCLQWRWWSAPSVSKNTSGSSLWATASPSPPKAPPCCCSMARA